MKSVAAALSLRTIGHLKQNEVIGQTLRVRPPPAWRPLEPQRAGKLAGGSDILEDPIPPPELGTREHAQARREQERRHRGAPHLREAGQGGPVGLGGGPACPSRPCAPASMLRRAPESCPVPGGPVSEPYPHPGRWEPRASSSNSSRAATCDTHGSGL